MIIHSMVMLAMLLTLQITHFVYMHATRLGRARTAVYWVIDKQLFNEVECAPYFFTDIHLSETRF